ncbi:MAG: molybdopterin-synthase adenylyltransferase MoeB [Cytophagales bacterium]|nr:molybdopterin-synthase adenylyltransferase MoeB [Cytophagales bacterium]
MGLSKEELLRYNRQIRIPEFGLAAQEKLKAASVLVIGAGGLGSPVLMYLTAAGVGKIGIVENDIIDVSNLQRQVLFSEGEVGKEKITQAKKRLNTINGNVDIEIHSTRLTRINALEILKKYDIVLDGSDNFPTRYLVNDACEILNKPFISGAIYRFEGQVSVFNYSGGPTYRDLFEKPPSQEMAPNCATAGVLGMMAGIVGSIQATEAIKVLTGVGEVLSGKLLLIDALSMNFRKIRIQVNPKRKEITELIDYELFCNPNANTLESITFDEFLKLKPQIKQLIDVREPDEYVLNNLGGELMPLSEIEQYLPRIKQDGVVVVHCQSGMRSKRAIQLLKEKYGIGNLINLEGGLNAARS